MRRSGARLTETVKWKAAAVAISAWLGFAGFSTALTVPLVETESEWRYLDDGSDQGAAWTDPLFDDSSWLSGRAQLGYGDGDEVTIVRCRVGWPPGQACIGSDPRIITTYFRYDFEVGDPSVFTSLDLTLLKDDGAVVYLNGAEVARSNMPAGGIDYLTEASATSQDNEVTLHSLDVAGLVAGTNVLAVEIHQASPLSSDISFDIGLEATNPTLPDLLRGPYLQIGTPESAVLRWRTDQAVSSRVEYGDDPANLSFSVEDLTLRTDHEINLTGLLTDFKYFYSVGTNTGVLAGANSSHFFVTSPAVGTTPPIRIWAIGDSGTADSSAASVRSAYSSYAAGVETDVWLMLGDNAYGSGTDTEYQQAVFDMYPRFLRNTFLWPTLGNHDTLTAGNPGLFPYFDIFSLPTGGEAGGLPSGTEAYYSFDYGNVHFVCLDSASSDPSVGGPMMDWLEADLGSTTQRWILAFWHHPPYSKGSHDSDSETKLVDMRENALPILESAGVDLVLSGHSHGYERSFLLNGHYGTSDTLVPGMILDGGDGDPAGGGAYFKLDTGHAGAVYTVAGNAAKIGAVDQHPAMGVWLAALGSLVIDIAGDRLDAALLRETGEIDDVFTLIKGVRPDLAVGDVQVVEGNSGTTDAVFSVTLAGPTLVSVLADYSTQDETASGGSDYQTVTGTLSIPPGVNQVLVTVPVLGDNEPEADETFLLQLTNIRNANPVDDQGVATIMDDESTLIFQDGFETGGTSRWSTTIP